MLITIFAPCMTCWHRNRINGRRLGTARPFPLWRLHSGPQSSSVDQYSETPPEHLASTVAEAMRRSVVTRNYPPNNSRGYLQLDPRLSSVWPRCCLEAGDTAARISLLRKNWPCLVRGLLLVIDHSHSTSPEGC